MAQSYKVDPHPTAVHIGLAPSVAAIHRDESWDSELGGELHVISERKSPLLSVLGGSMGVATFADHDAIRLSLNVYAATRLIADVPMGLSVGPIVDLFHEHRPRAGVRSTLWVYAGITPIVSVARLWGLGSPAGLEVELGFRIPFSVWRW